MKKYWLFAGDYYYPQGGISDFISSFHSIEEATEYLRKIRYDWFQVVDSNTGSIVEEKV